MDWREPFDRDVAGIIDVAGIVAPRLHRQVRAVQVALSRCGWSIGLRATLAVIYAARNGLVPSDAVSDLPEEFWPVKAFDRSFLGGVPAQYRVYRYVAGDGPAVVTREGLWETGLTPDPIVSGPRE